MGELSIHILGETRDVMTCLHMDARALIQFPKEDLKIQFPEEDLKKLVHVAAHNPEISTKDLKDAKIGQYIMIKLTDDREVRFDIVDRGRDWLRLDSHDCIGESAWNKNGSTEGDIRLSDLQKYVNGLEELLPAEWRGAIAPTIRYTEEYEGENGETEEYLTRLFVPDASEVFGPDPDWYETRYDQLDFYKDRRNRMKASEPGGTEMRSWWTASAYSGNATNSVLVNANGRSNNYNASNAHGVPVCFRINL